MKRGAQTMKRLLSFVMVLAMMLSLVPATVFAAETGTTVYLKPNANWKKDGARFAVYYFENDANGWVSMTEASRDGYYTAEVPTGYSTIIFCRMNPGTTENNWDNKWNQTENLSLPTDTATAYVVAEDTWDNGGGSWSVYGEDDSWPEETPKETAYYVAGSDGLCGAVWQADGDAMTENADGTWSVTFPEVEANTYEFKITDGTWDNAWPGSNYQLTVTEKSSVTITFNPETKDIQVAVNALPAEPQTITVYFRNDWLWPEVDIHYWGGDDVTDTSWPGVAMTKVGTDSGKDVYSAQIPAGVTGIIFNGLNNDNRDERQQTPNIESGIADGNAYYIYWDGENKAGTFDYQPTPVEPDEPDEGTKYTAIFHFADVLNWGSVNLYTWHGAANTTLTGGWPGTALERDADGYYSYTVTYEPTDDKGLNFIFNGGGAQTVDLNLPDSAFVDGKAEKWVKLTDTEGGKYLAQIQDEPMVFAVSPKVDGTSVTFEYLGDAQTVTVCGDFTNWGAKPVSMTKNAKGIWTVTVTDLEPGDHEYKFVVDGQWITDPCNSETANGNSVFTVFNPGAVDHNKITVNIHFKKTDDDYTGWNLWVWSNSASGKQYDFAESDADEDGKLCVITLEDARAYLSLGFKPRRSTAGSDWAQEAPSDYSLDLKNIVSGTMDYYVTYDVSTNTWTSRVKKQMDVAFGVKLTSVKYDYETDKVSVTAASEITDAGEAFTIVSRDEAQTVSVTDVAAQDTTYTLTLDRELELSKLYQYRVGFGGYTYEISVSDVYASDKFAAEYTYTGSDLGAAYTASATTFRLWAPTATEVKVNLYQGGTAGVDDRIEQVPMTADVSGTWVATKSGDLNGVYYTYDVTVNGETVEAIDPYARTTGVNGQRGMVIDLSATGSVSELSGKIQNYTDAVIYEMHVRDFSIQNNVEHQGKYLGVIESGTTSGGKATGLNYLKELGVNLVHLLPVYDYGSVDETTSTGYNWGYDPKNYNVPEGSYSTDPYNGAVRVKEMKQMVSGLHEAGIGVIMDVVYNHVYDASTFSFNLIVPDYFSRADGSNGSGCGNDTASEREMVRKYIVDSVKYWADEYRIDGFRFDLVGLLDTQTINEIVAEVHKTHPHVIFYGEGWTMSTNAEPGTTMATQTNAGLTPGFAYFSDNMRGVLAGDSNGGSLGFVSGASGKESDLVRNFLANPGWSSDPEQVVQYVSCHDNNTLIDKIIKSTGKSGIDAEAVQMNNLAAAIYLTSQGIPFIHSGEEILREKLDASGNRVHNSYNAGDAVNAIQWSKLDDETYASNFAYYQGLIAFRKAHAALRMTSASEISTRVIRQTASENLVSFWINGKDVDTHDSIYVVFNANKTAKTVTLPAGNWDVCIDGKNAGTKALKTVSGTVEVAGISALVLVQKETEAAPEQPQELYLVGYINGADYDGTDYKFVDGKLTVKFTGDTYLAVKKSDGTVYMTDGWQDFGKTSMTLYDSTTLTDSNKWAVPNGVELTFSLVCNADGSLTVSYTQGVLEDPDALYLYGYINGKDVGDNSYKFDENGKLTVTLTGDSYVAVKNGDGSQEYWTDGYQGTVTETTLYNKKTHTLVNDKFDKLLVPAGEVVFTLIRNDDGSLTLRYENASQPGGFRDKTGIQEGVTLHCWNWSFAEIEANMAQIAAQGYTAIQTSPVQAMKEDTTGKSVGTHWWVYYQPVDFKINDASGNALGTKSQLESMITTAHQYGVKVIVDVVANHLGNETANDLSPMIPASIRNNSDYWHDIATDITDWSDRFDMTQHCMSGLPDLNTSNADVQNMVLDFLKACVDVGVDGFRFDAAKSIETPDDDASFASDFWPTVIGGAAEYADSKGKDLYFYGETLDDIAISASAYTKYMAITDNGWGNHLRMMLNGETETATLNKGYYKTADASQLVVWAESHDTYADGTSTNVSETVINKTWALIAARADVMGLYLARPETTEQALGVASKTAWTSREVKAVNCFHSDFLGQPESIGNEGNVAYVERGTSGAVLVNTKGAAAAITVTANALADGAYTDKLTGNSFTVSGGKITGQIGATGIAVLYPAAQTYTVTIKETSGGKVTADQQNPAVGETVTITVTPDEGKTLDTISAVDAMGNPVPLTKQSLARAAETLVYTYTQPESNVTVTVTFKSVASAPTDPTQPDSTDPTEAPKYKVTVKKSANGTITVNNQTPAAGETVTITVKPNADKQIGTVTVTAKDGTKISVTNKGSGVYTYAQPEADVTVSASFLNLDGSPATGDNSNIGLWIGVMALMLVLLAVLIVLKIKKK